MKVSKNEFTTLLKQAFEGCGFSLGGYQTAAKLVVWCKMHGFDISSALTAQKIAGFFQQDQHRIDILEDNENTLTVDFKGTSFIASGVKVAELVYAKSVSTDVCIGKFSDCKDRKLVAQSVATMGKRGFHCAAFWRDNEETHLINIARTVSGQCCPEYARYRSVKPNNESAVALDETSLFLVCAKNSSMLQQYIETVCSEIKGKPYQCWLPAGSKANYRSSLMDGIDVSAELWALLGQYRDKVLVESTEQSRKGAGA